MIYIALALICVLFLVSLDAYAEDNIKEITKTTILENGNVVTKIESTNSDIYQIFKKLGFNYHNNDDYSKISDFEIRKINNDTWYGTITKTTSESLKNEFGFYATYKIDNKNITAMIYDIENIVNVTINNSDITHIEIYSVKDECAIQNFKQKNKEVRACKEESFVSVEAYGLDSDILYNIFTKLGKPVYGFINPVDIMFDAVTISITVFLFFAVIICITSHIFKHKESIAGLLIFLALILSIIIPMVFVEMNKIVPV